MSMEIVIGLGMFVVWVAAILVLLRGKRKDLPLRVRMEQRFSSPSSGENSITNFDSAAGQIYQMRVEEEFERLKGSAKPVEP